MLGLETVDYKLTALGGVRDYFCYITNVMWLHSFLSWFVCFCSFSASSSFCFSTHVQMSYSPRLCLSTPCFGSGWFEGSPARAERELWCSGVK